MTTKLKMFTYDEVEKHKLMNSCWVLKGKYVYDITDFLDDHPGGAELILEYGGKDITEIMADEESHVHSDAAYEMLEEYLIGTVTSDAAEAALHDAAEDEPIYKNTGMSTAEDLNKETDLEADFKKHHFLDLNRPLIPQMWTGGFSKAFYLDQVHRPRHYKGGASAPLFGNFLEPLTKTAWWVIPLVWLPAITCGVLIGMGGMPNKLVGAAYFSLGYSLWSLIEYSMHRFLFHIDE